MVQEPNPTFHRTHGQDNHLLRRLSNGDTTTRVHHLGAWDYLMQMLFEISCQLEKRDNGAMQPPSNPLEGAQVFTVTMLVIGRKIATILGSA